MMIDVKQNVIRSLLDLLTWFDLLVYILEKKRGGRAILFASLLLFGCHLMNTYIVSIDLNIWKEKKFAFSKNIIWVICSACRMSIYATSPSTMTIHRKSVNIVKR